MTLNELKGFIDILVEKGHGSKVVVYSCDDEGNGYCDIHYHPGILKLSDMDDYRGIGKNKVICIN